MGRWGLRCGQGKVKMSSWACLVLRNQGDKGMLGATGPFDEPQWSWPRMPPEMCHSGPGRSPQHEAQGARATEMVGMCLS